MFFNKNLIFTECKFPRHHAWRESTPFCHPHICAYSTHVWCARMYKTRSRVLKWNLLRSLKEPAHCCFWSWSFSVGARFSFQVYISGTGHSTRPDFYFILAGTRKLFLNLPKVNGPSKTLLAKKHRCKL